MGILSGMTGFARTDGTVQDISWAWEVRSVNGRGLETRFRWPHGFERLEAKARELAKARFGRGHLQVNLTVKQDKASGRLNIDRDRIDQILLAADPFIRDGRVSVPSFDGLLAVSGVLDPEQPSDDEAMARVDQVLTDGLCAAFDALLEARRDEGEAMSSVLSGHVDEIERLTGEAAQSAAIRIDSIRDRIATKFDELLPDGLPEDRLAIEAAAWAVKMDVREEIDRLQAHIQSARELLSAGSPVGRKLDFLTQEFNREANTLCSKSSDSSLTRIGLDLKNVVDQLREQVQNVE